jgi:hypothetical protein
MGYRSFDEVELPVGAVTEAAPGARLDYARFASDAVLAFHRRQVDEIRPRSPGRPITHNDMGFFADLDAHALGRDLDAITWDSYPSACSRSRRCPTRSRRARADRPPRPDRLQPRPLPRRARRTGDGAPYRPFWVMEQQPGQVNWARPTRCRRRARCGCGPTRRSPTARRSSSYFRWRAAQGAQEHMHAGLLRHDRSPDQGLAEAAAAAGDLAATAGARPPPRPRGAPVPLRRPLARPGRSRTPKGGATGRCGPSPTWRCAPSGSTSTSCRPTATSRPTPWWWRPRTIADDALVASLRRALDAGATVVLGPRSGAYRPTVRARAGARPARPN